MRREARGERPQSLRLFAQGERLRPRVKALARPAPRSHRRAGLRCFAPQCDAGNGPRYRLLSEQDVELHRRLYEAFNARDVDSLFALCDADVTIQSAFAAVSGGDYHGHDGVRGWQGDLADARAMTFA